MDPSLIRSGEAGRLARQLAALAELARRGALEVEAVKVDRLEQQGREAAFLHRRRDDLAREGEEDSRRLGEEEGLDLVGRYVAHRDEAGIEQVDGEGGLAVGGGAHLDPEGDLVDLVGELADADVEIDLDLGLGLPLEDGGRVRILERHILHILGDDAGLRLIVRAVRLLFAAQAFFFGHCPTFIGMGRTRGRMGRAGSRSGRTVQHRRGRNLRPFESFPS